MYSGAMESCKGSSGWNAALKPLMLRNEMQHYILTNSLKQSQFSIRQYLSLDVLPLVWRNEMQHLTNSLKQSQFSIRQYWAGQQNIYCLKENLKTYMDKCYLFTCTQHLELD